MVLLTAFKQAGVGLIQAALRYEANNTGAMPGSVIPQRAAVNGLSFLGDINLVYGEDSVSKCCLWTLCQVWCWQEAIGSLFSR